MDIIDTEGFLQQWEDAHNYECDECESTLSTASNLKTHKLTIHGGERQFKCSTCGYLAHTESILKTHFKVHTEEYPYKCDVCDYASKWSSNLKKHKVCHNKHNAEGHRQVKCGKCESILTSAITLKRHQIKFHGGVNVFKCSKCGYLAFSESKLKKHLKVHTENCPNLYKCSICDYSSKHSGHVLRHQIAHGKEKTHKCDECEATLSTASNLRRHKLTVHQGGTRFYCFTCGYIPFSKSSLRRHILVHTAVNPWSNNCDYAHQQNDETSLICSDI